MATEVSAVSLDNEKNIFDTNKNAILRLAQPKLFRNNFLVFDPSLKNYFDGVGPRKNNF